MEAWESPSAWCNKKPEDWHLVSEIVYRDHLDKAKICVPNNLYFGKKPPCMK